MALLERLGLVRGGSLTAAGNSVRRMPLHPRLARMLLEAGGSRDMARACAILSERHLLPQRTASTASDLLSALDRWDAMPPHVRRAADDIGRAAAAIGGKASREPTGEAAFRRAVLAGFPDRVGQRRSSGSPRVLMASGTGAVLSPESGVVGGEFLVALDLHAFRDNPDARIRIASVVDREWLSPTAVETVHRIDAQKGVVRAVQVERYGALSLGERPVARDPEVAARLLAEAWLARRPDAEDQRLLRRARFAGHDLDLAALVTEAAADAASLGDIRLGAALPHHLRSELDRNAPETLRVPSGRSVRLEYGEDGTVSASVKLQELFGLAETPRVGPNREPVLFALLAPNGRPVQLTRDLRSFWNRTYPEVRKELRGRYPKHAWPEDPWR